MKEGRIAIYWFSGTGNTLKTVEAMAGVFRAAGREIKLLPMIGTAPSETDAAVLGLAFPVACQGTYPFVWDFCAALPEGQGQEIFMLDTLAKFSGGIVGPLGKFLRAKNYRTIGAREIQMPNNFFPRDLPEEKLRQAVTRGEEAARAFAAELLAGTASWEPGPAIISGIWGWMARLKLNWRLMARLGKRFRIDPGKCVLCNKCVELCPTKNITMDKLPVFGNSCVQCQRCVMLCPSGAILIKSKSPVRYRAVSAAELLAKEKTGER